MIKQNNTPKEESKEPRKDDLGEMFRTAVVAVLLALMIRTFLFEPFNIPSSSMVPNLLIGDYLFVSKYSYGYSKHSFPFGLGGFEGRIMDDTPKRGDIAVFKLPTQPSIDYIKRVIGLPGDTVQVREGRLYINGQLMDREFMGLREYEDDSGNVLRMTEFAETLPEGQIHIIYEEGDNQPLDNTEVFEVPQGHYFMMGNNRDNSSDSRVSYSVGYVPYDHFVGRAEFIFFSENGGAKIYEVWKWPTAIRWDRLFQKIQ